MRLLGYKYFVHFSVCHLGAENANNRTVHKFLKNFWNDTAVAQQRLFHNLLFRIETWIIPLRFWQQSMQWNKRSGQNCHFITLRNSVYSAQQHVA